MPIFAGHSDEAQAALEEAVTMRLVKAGKKVFKAGAVGDELYIVRSGTVKLTLPIHKKEGYHMATCEPGEIIGGVGFLDGTAHTADALALTDVEVYVLTRGRFLDLTTEHQAIAFAIVANIAHSLSTRLRVSAAEIAALRG